MTKVNVGATADLASCRGAGFICWVAFRYFSLTEKTHTSSLAEKKPRNCSWLSYMKDGPV